MYNPFSKGRWYRFRIESDGTNITITESDISGATVNYDKVHVTDNGKLILPIGYRVLSEIADVNSISSVESVNAQLTAIGSNSEGNQFIILPPPTLFRNMELYVFANKA